jgi:lysophospholipase L1-like esterase
MHEPFWRLAAATGALVAVLAGLSLLPVPVYSRTEDTFPKKLLRTLHKDELNREAREAQTAGYYEGLLNEGSRVSGMNAIVTGNDRFTPESWMRPERRHRGDFLYWDMPPNLTTRDAENPRGEIVTNSHGMTDKEYTIEKPPDTWRVALLGDSITRGHGAPFGTSYEYVLEDRLNADHFTPRGRRLEILNFAVGGYRVTQLVDVAIERVPAFSPDVYVLPLSELSVFRNWGDHIATLVQNGIDLKYDYLRQMVREAGLRPSDPTGTIAAKLARFRLPTLRWALNEIRAAAASNDAEVLVVLIASGSEPERLEEQFIGVRELLADLDFHYIDLLDAFADVDDPVRYRVSERNIHPNELGHRRLYERLHEQVLGDGEFFRLLCGPDIPWPQS